MIDPLEHALGAAIDGDRAEVEHFFKVLLGSTLTVAKRFQHLPLSDSPEYPNEFLDILGVQDKERVVVPVFTRPDLVKEWSGAEFLVREMSLPEIISVLPDDWWLVLNPGGEIEKEISPWELSQLKAGAEAIPVLVEENSAFESERGMAFIPPPAEFTKIQDELSKFARTRPAIQSLYLLQRDRGDSEGLPALVVGVRTELQPSSELDTLRAEILAISERGVIGAATMQVMMGGAVGGSMLDGVFASFTPFYSTKNSGILGKLTSVFVRKNR